MIILGALFNKIHLSQHSMLHVRWCRWWVCFKREGIDWTRGYCEENVCPSIVESLICCRYTFHRNRQYFIYQECCMLSLLVTITSIALHSLHSFQRVLITLLCLAGINNGIQAAVSCRCLWAPGQKWIMTENESANWNFRMYRHNGPRPRPSLYTKYYRNLW